MKTEYLKASEASDIQRAGELLRSGELVAVPTETVYGLAADASNPVAVEKIFAAKGRPRNHPLIVHLGSLSMLDQWAAEVPDWLMTLGKTFWPGPLTVILEKHPGVTDVITGGLSTVGLRIPDHPALLNVLQTFNLAVAAPSANPYKKLSPTTPEQVFEVMQGKISAVLDGGPCHVGTESTILQVLPDEARILRSGPIKAPDLQAFLPVPVVTPRSHQYAVSGNKQEHYQPDSPLSVLNSDDLVQGIRMHRSDEGYLVYSPALANLRHPNLVVLPSDHAGYRKMLYTALYQLDKKRLQRIIVESPPDTEAWLDIGDRLSRAASST